MNSQRLTGFLFVCWISRSTVAKTATVARRAYSTSPSPPTSLVERDIHLTTPQLIAAYGYPIETHHVTTQDGYILELHRIPSRGKAAANRVVLVQHGVLCSSADWVVMGPRKGFAYILSDAGYDVWLGNARGNTYSKKHDKHISKQQFWSFSFHEMGVYDLPAVIDYILQTTGTQQLHYVGHSMGTTIFYVMASERPEYNSKVRVMVSMAPVAYLAHMPSRLLRFLSAIGDQISWLLMHTGFMEFQLSRPVRELMRSVLCPERAASYGFCFNLIFLVAGYDSKQFNKTMLPVITAHTPAGTSTKVLQHYSQVVKSGRFQQMNLGTKENTARYGSPTPPEYNLSRVTVPIALFTGDNDVISAREDVDKLQLRLKNVIGRHRVPFSRFNHLDFLWANDAKRLVYDDVINVLDNW